MPLISLAEIEWCEGKSIFHSTYSKASILQLSREKKFKKEQEENVYDFGEYIVMMYKLGKESFKNRKMEEE